MYHSYSAPWTGTSLSRTVRAVGVVWQREVMRFWGDRARMITSLLQPLLVLFALGSGLSTLTESTMPPGIDLKTFVYPGVLVMSVVFTALFATASVVWDREFGFLREILVAPVGRWAIVAGKCLGSSTVAILQTLPILALAALAHVPYSPSLLITMLGELILLALTMSAFAMLLAVRAKRIQSFMAIMQLIVMPLFFLSGALYPLNGLPRWLEVLALIDPVSYIVGPLRTTVFENLRVPHAELTTLSAGVSWDGWSFPVPLSLLMVAVMGAASLVAAIVQLRRVEY